MEKNNVVAIYMYLNGIINDAFPLRTFKDRNTRINYNLLLELQNESFKEERYHYHQNQFHTGSIIVEYNILTPVEMDDYILYSKFRRFPKVPHEYSGMIKKEFTKLSSYLKGETIQFKPSEYGLQWDEYTPSLLIKLT